jgi:hypothetical protein
MLTLFAGRLFGAGSPRNGRSIALSIHCGATALASHRLGVQLWEVMPAEDQRNMLTDLTMTWEARPPGVADRLRDRLWKPPRCCA